MKSKKLRTDPKAYRTLREVEARDGKIKPVLKPLSEDPNWYPCPNCGKTVGVDDTSCHYCGLDLNK